MAPLHKPKSASVRPAFLPAHEPLSIMDAIYSRRTVRHFTGDEVPEAALHALLYAAVQAPTVVAGDVWGFAVIQDRRVLKTLSDDAGRLYRGGDAPALKASAVEGEGYFNIFFNAPALVIIYGNMEQPFSQADCWLAAENLMLAACGMGLGSCVIGLAVDVLGTVEWKTRLDIPPEMTAVAPIVLGYPAKGSDPVLRPPPNVLSWLRN